MSFYKPPSKPSIHGTLEVVDFLYGVDPTEPVFPKIKLLSEYTRELLVGQLQEHAKQIGSVALAPRTELSLNDALRDQKILAERLENDAFVFTGPITIPDTIGLGIWELQ